MDKGEILALFFGEAWLAMGVTGISDLIPHSPSNLTIFRF